MQLINISNLGRKIYLFTRDNEGKLSITEDNSFFPYFYEPSEEGKYISYNGIKLKKNFCCSPRDVYKLRSNKSFESDVNYCKQYIINKIDKIEKCPIKWCFLDIEVLCEELPDVNEAKYPISCITIYNSFNKEYKTFYLGDYLKRNKVSKMAEKRLIEDFLTYFKVEKFDLFISWNVSFDYDYMYNRIKNFAKLISPIGQLRYGHDNIAYPSGISIVDYMEWDKKITLKKRRSYSLENVSIEELKDEEKIEKIKFGVLDEVIMAKNIRDVKRMVMLEEKLNYIPYINEIRMLSKIEWEDVEFNSRVIDMLLLQEAKNRNTPLPMRPKGVEREKYEGAYKEVLELGKFNDITKYDISGAYPGVIIDFCLDPSNIVKESEDGVRIENSIFIQNNKALLPTIVKQLIELKNKIKEEKLNTSIEHLSYKDICRKYEAIKAITNSAYGTMGNPYFRFYNYEVASSTTFLIRDLLHYVQDKLLTFGFKIIYLDTDGIFIKTRKNLTELLNDLVIQWAKEKYNKTTSIEFIFEGVFERLLILAKCHYVGYINNGKGTEKEIKGVEIKRKDSSKYLAEFQNILIDKILNNELKDNIVNWIKRELERIKTLPLEDIAFPAKLTKKKEEYKSNTVVLKALENTKKFINYDAKIGDNFYYIYIEPIENKVITKVYIDEQLYQSTEQDLTRKEVLELLKDKIDLKAHKINVLHSKEAIDVLVFDEENKSYLKDIKIDWDRMIERNIINKIELIFEVLGWNLDFIKKEI